MPLLKQNIRLNAMTNPLCCGKSNEIMRRDNDGSSGGPAYVATMDELQGLLQNQMNCDIRNKMVDSTYGELRTRKNRRKCTTQP